MSLTTILTVAVIFSAASFCAAFRGHAWRQAAESVGASLGMYKHLVREVNADGFVLKIVVDDSTTFCVNPKINYTIAEGFNTSVVIVEEDKCFGSVPHRCSSSQSRRKGKGHLCSGVLRFFQEVEAVNLEQFKISKTSGLLEEGLVRVNSDSTIYDIVRVDKVTNIPTYLYAHVLLRELLLESVLFVYPEECNDRLDSVVCLFETYTPIFTEIYQKAQTAQT